MLQGEELATAFASADAFLFPSTTETLGIAMIEALASGLPVLAARTGAAGEVVDEGETGLLYDPGSDAVARRRREKHRLGRWPAGRMGRNARAAAERRDWGSSTHTLRGYYEQALGESMSEAKAKLKSGGKRFSKFSIVGLSNAAIDIGMLNLFLWLAPTREVTLLVLYNGVALVLANLNSYALEHAVDLSGVGPNTTRGR